MSTTTTTTTVTAPVGGGVVVDGQPRPESGDSEMATTSVIHQTKSARTYAPVYDRFSRGQKRSMTSFLAFVCILATSSTTSMLAAVPEITETFGTTATVINISNALFLAIMGISCCFWGPWADTFGRRSAFLISTTLFFGASIGTALAPNLAAFFAFRAITGFQATAFQVLGSTCVSDMYHPTERGKAMGLMLFGTALGPSLGPIVGGAIVTYTSWRVIFWVQAGLGGLALILTIFILRETLQQPRYIELRGDDFATKARTLWAWSNPATVLALYRERGLLCAVAASSACAWNMYTLLTPIRYILNPRLGLTTPLQSGLLYLAPGGGFVLGTFIGGRWSDRTVRKWMRRRGFRLWEDRLRAGFWILAISLPGAMLLYAWSVDRGFGGVALPAVSMFAQGLSQTTSFPAVNVYILDSMQHKSGKASAAHYLMRYVFSAVATAACLPMIDGVGVGWTGTVSAALVLVGAALVQLTIRCGRDWRAQA